MSIYLASRRVPRLREFVDDYAIGRRTCLVPIAAEPIEQGQVETQAALEAVRAANLEVEFIAHTRDEALLPPPLQDFHVIILGPGDQFYLLARLRELGLDLQLREAVSHGSVVVGIGAGAVVLGPAISPWIMASQFAPEDGMYLVRPPPHRNGCAPAPQRSRSGRSARRRHRTVRRYVPGRAADRR